MKYRIGIGLCLTLAYGSVYAQTHVGPEFEVASIKPSRPLPGKVLIAGGPGTSDPGQITYHDRSLTELIYLAYEVKSYQASLPPWMGNEHFDIVARVPAGATKADVRIMLQNLLVERFHVKVRHELRETQAYVLTVGKSGSKMNAYPLPLPDDVIEATPRFHDGEDKDGFLVIPRGYATAVISTRDGLTRFSFARVPISLLCSALASSLQQPVVDGTGLAGRYDVRLAFAKDTGPAIGPVTGEEAPPQAPDPEPTLFSAIEKRLGLKLERKTLPVDFFVVVGADKAPTEN